MNNQKLIIDKIQEIHRLTEQRNKKLLQLVASIFWEKMNKLYLTEHDIKTIEKAYKKAVKDNLESFKVKLSDGQEAELLRQYAKYLLEYFKMIKKG